MREEAKDRSLIVYLKHREELFGLLGRTAPPFPDNKGLKFKENIVPLVPVKKPTVNVYQAEIGY